MREWMSPAGEAEAEVDLRVGGAFRVTMKGQGLTIDHHGQYREVDPPRRLVFTWVSRYTGAEPSLFTVDLEPAGGGTELRIVHERLPEDVAEALGGGWAAMLDRLAGRLDAEDG